jgi:hypothetical protein
MVTKSALATVTVAMLSVASSGNSQDSGKHEPAMLEQVSLSATALSTAHIVAAYCKDAKGKWTTKCPEGAMAGGGATYLASRKADLHPVKTRRDLQETLQLHGMEKRDAASLASKLTKFLKSPKVAGAGLFSVASGAVAYIQVSDDVIRTRPRVPTDADVAPPDHHDKPKASTSKSVEAKK